MNIRLNNNILDSELLKITNCYILPFLMPRKYEKIPKFEDLLSNFIFIQGTWYFRNAVPLFSFPLSQICLKKCILQIKIIKIKIKK